MRSETPKAQAIRYWWTKATQSLSAARRELAAGDYALAVNRAYCGPTRRTTGTARSDESVWAIVHAGMYPLVTGGVL